MHLVCLLGPWRVFEAEAYYIVGDRVGRRYGICVGCVIFSVGVALQTAAVAVPLYAIGRVVAGMGVGVVSTIVPMYQSETAPKWIRGAVVSCYQWAITIGLLMAAIVNNGFKDYNTAASYRWPTSLQFIWATILVVRIQFLPESPRCEKTHEQQNTLANEQRAGQG